MELHGTVAANQAYIGGGIYIQGTAAYLSGKYTCNITNNRAARNAGGAGLGESPTLTLSGTASIVGNTYNVLVFCEMG